MINSKDIVEISNLDTAKHFTISWKMTDWCNFNCPYCITGKHNCKLTPFDLICQRAKNINRIINQVPQGKKIRLHFIGGEVTYYDLITVLKNIDLTRVDALNLITNFSQNLHWFSTFIRFLNDHKIQLTLVASYHEQFGTKVEFIDKLAYIRQRFPRVNLLLSAVVDQNPDFSFFNKAKAIGVKLNLSLLRNCVDNKNLQINQELAAALDKYDDKSGGITNHIYTDRKRYIFGTSAAANNQVVDGGLIATNYWCTAGSTTCRILPNGDVVGAGCNYCQKFVLLGNIDNDDVSLLDAPIQCHLDSNRRCNFCYKVNISKTSDI